MYFYRINSEKKTFGPPECWCNYHGEDYYPCKKNNLCKETHKKFTQINKKYMKTKKYKNIIKEIKKSKSIKNKIDWKKGRKEFMKFIKNNNL